MCSRVNAGGPGPGTRRLGTWPSVSGRKRREARSRVHSSGDRSSFVCARRERQAATETHSHLHRVLYPHSHATLRFSPLASPSLPFCPSISPHPCRPSPSNPNGPPTCLLRRRRGAVSGVGRRGGPAVSDPGPAPLGCVIRGNSRGLLR